MILQRSACLLIAALYAALLCAPALAQPAGSALVAEQRRIEQAFEAEQRAFSEAYAKASSDEERDRIKFPDRDKYASQMLAAAEKNIKDPAAIEALVWTLTHGRQSSEPMAQALGLLQKHFLEDNRMDTVCEALEFDDSAASKVLLNDLVQKSPHRHVKGAAALTLGQLYAESDPRQAERYLSDVQKFGTRTQIESARGHLFQMKNLAIGKVAPTIEGEDVDGKSFKLDDYRGRVVMLSFWGDW